MTSVAAKRRKKKRRNKPHTAAQAPVRTPTTQKAKGSTQPTPERRARGKWVQPTGKVGMQDIASDMIGRLFTEKKLTAQQEASARVFQETHAAYVAELGVTGYKSCLAGGSGHDNGDGNPEAVRAYYAMRDRIGAIACGILSFECAKLADEKPRSLSVLIDALNRMG